MSFPLKLALIVLAVLGAAYIVFILMAPDTIAPTSQDPNQNAANGTDVITGEAQTVAASRTYANGEHTVRGTIQLPTPCYDLEHEVVVMESYPEQVVINFTSADQGGICVQVIDDRAFEVKFKASEQATVRATLNGKPLILQLQAR